MQNPHQTVLLRVLDVVQSLALYGLPVSTALFAVPGATEGYRVPKDAVAQGAIVIFVAAWTLKHLWAEDLMEALRSLILVDLHWETIGLGFLVVAVAGAIMLAISVRVIRNYD